jgi:CxxC-x17-CxxC domain-containing protein|tara:strand:- start:360 stop:716 length:357 start_codon:yes stop_codon:yes gene_type:complete
MRNFSRDDKPSRSRGSSRRDSGRSDRGGSRDFDRRDSDSRFGGRRAKPEMHDVVCDKCGKECEVPFKPTSSKPVYCSNCFEKEGGDSRGSRSGPGSSSKDLEQINKKLDKIMQALEIE